LQCRLLSGLSVALLPGGAGEGELPRAHSWVLAALGKGCFGFWLSGVLGAQWGAQLGAVERGKCPASPHQQGLIPFYSLILHVRGFPQWSLTGPSLNPADGEQRTPARLPAGSATEGAKVRAGLRVGPQPLLPQGLGARRLFIPWETSLIPASAAGSENGELCTRVMGSAGAVESGFLKHGEH